MEKQTISNSMNSGMSRSFGAVAFASIALRLACVCLTFTLLTGGVSAKEVRYIIKLRESADLRSTLRTAHALPLAGESFVRSGVTFKRPLAALSKPPRRTSHYRGPSESALNPLERALFATADDQNSSAALIAQMVGPDNVEYIERDPQIISFAIPTDDLFPRQWHLLNDGQVYTGIERVEGSQNDLLVPDSGLANEDVGLRGHYAQSQPARKRPLIAIIDTGVDDLHPEIVNNIWRNPDEIPGNGVDDDHNGYADDIIGWDFSGDSLRISGFLEDNDPSDEVGHGSHIAGIISAAADGTGVVGVCPQADLMALKIFPNAFGSVGAAAVIYAVNNGADILNVSWGTEFRSRFLDEAFAYAVANDLFVAVASGNSLDNQRFQPADIEELFTVGATNSRGKVTFFSTYGAHVDMVAPGQDILSIRGQGTDMYASVGEPYLRIVNGLYYLSDGTSMATPMIAGAAGFLLSVRPELSADEIAQTLRDGARDIVQPYDTGASYPGVDSLSGWGSLDIDRSVALLGGSNMVLMEPRDYTRVTGNFTVRALPIEGYSAGWTLSAGSGPAPDSFVDLASGGSFPVDSALFVYDNSLPGGLITLRLTDAFGVESRTRVYISRPARTELSYPLAGDTLRGIVDIRGYAHASDFDSLRLLLYDYSSASMEAVYSSSAESYGGVMYSFEVGARATGEYRLVLESYSQSSLETDSADVVIVSLLHPGWPQALGDFAAISPVAYDLDGDSLKELIVGTRSGVHAFHIDGSTVSGFPVVTERDCRSVPAVDDIDGDGKPDIVFTSDSGLHVVDAQGKNLSGWPQRNPTGQVFLGFPTPQLLSMTPESGEAVVYVNSTGQLRAFHFNGESYFYSLGGLFTRIDPNLTNDYQFRGLSIPQVASIDYDNNGRPEIMAAYSSPGAVSGLFLFNGRDGQPVNWRPSAEALRVGASHGMALGDVDNDGYTEALISGENEDGVITLWLRRNGEVDLPGWPIPLTGVVDWIGAYPSLSDLDADGVPEVVAVYTEYDISKIFAFRLNGEPFRTSAGLEYGELLSIDESLSSVSVADIDGDGVAELVSRSGFVFPGSGFERLHAFTVEGSELPGFPLVTTASPGAVTSFGFVPLIDDLDNDGLVEIALVGSGGLVHVWDMPGAWAPQSWDWPRFMRDSRNSSEGGEPPVGHFRPYAERAGSGQ